MSRLRVFLSHLTVESRFADALIAHLQDDFIGLVDVFASSDSTSVPAGAQWLEKVLEQLNRSELHLVLCSDESVRRPWINYEAGAARLRDVPTVPLCHSGLTPAQLPVPLSASEGIALSDAKGLRKLYARIAQFLDSNVPPAPFDAYSAEFKALEAQYEQERLEEGDASLRVSDESIVHDPRVLCVSSDQFLELGFKNQLQIVLDAFPNHLRHDRVNNSKALRDLLLEERVDIVHIAAFVCPRSGTLYFSPVNLPSGSSAVAEPDRIPADALAMLLQSAHTRLVVLASCESLALATSLLSVTNVIAPRDVVSPQAMALWVEAFYQMLRLKPLAAACDYAFRVSQARMRLLAQQAAEPDLTFQEN